MKYWNLFKIYIQKKPNQRKVNIWLCTIFFLLVIGNLMLSRYNIVEEALGFFTTDAFELFASTIIAFTIYYIAKPRKSFVTIIVVILMSVFSFIALAFLKAERRGLPYQGHILEEVMSYIGMTFLLGFMFYFFDNLNLIINNSYEKTKEALREAEQQLLRLQFNPHFLYNAFNSLYSMSLQNHPNTSDSILKLSGMMRYLTDDVHISGSQLKHEFKFIKDYLALERIRFGEKANISFEIKGEVEGLLIEPLLLISLVENAFKHGFYTNNNNAFVNVIAEVADKDLKFTVRNSVFKKQHFQETNRAGKGLKSLRKRLELSYPNNADFQTTEKEDEYIARLNLKLK